MTKFVEKIRTVFLFNNLLPKIVPFMRYVEKYGITRLTTDDTLWRGKMRFSSQISKARIQTQDRCI
jgi:hypothetical protein